MPAPLSSTLVALLDPLLTAPAGRPGLRITSVTMEVAAEAVPARTSSGDPAVLIGPPQWRWRTAFDPAPGRLRFTVDIVEAAGGPW